MTALADKDKSFICKPIGAPPVTASTAGSTVTKRKLSAHALPNKKSVHYLFNHPGRLDHLVQHPKAKVWLFYTRFTVEDLNEILMFPEYLRVIYNKGSDSYNHLVLLDDSVIDRLKQERWNYIDFRPYMIDVERNFPTEDKTFNLYIKCPFEISRDDCIKIIEEKLKLFVKYGMVPADSWKIDCIYRRTSLDRINWKNKNPADSKKSRSCDSSPSTSPPDGSVKTPPIFYNLIVKFAGIDNHDMKLSACLVRAALQHDYWNNEGLRISCQWQVVK